VVPGKSYCEEHLISQREYAKKLLSRQREEVLSHYGEKCICCGESELKFLTIDHIDGGGNSHREKIGSNIYRWLIKNSFPQGFRILCFNCNCAIGIYGKCPHEENH
jgi:hypothetical protein